MTLFARVTQILWMAIRSHADLLALVRVHVCDTGIARDNANCVVVGLAPTQFQYNQLNEAFRSATVALCVMTLHSRCKLPVSPSAQLWLCSLVCVLGRHDVLALQLQLHFDTANTAVAYCQSYLFLERNSPVKLSKHKACSPMFSCCYMSVRL